MPRARKASRKNPANESTHTHVRVTSGTGSTFVGMTTNPMGEGSSIGTSHFHSETHSKARVPSKKH
jgi:hypothetical protein